jgi:hypothetical protein
MMGEGQYFVSYLTIYKKVGTQNTVSKSFLFKVFKEEMGLLV